MSDLPSSVRLLPTPVSSRIRRVSLGGAALVTAMLGCACSEVTTVDLFPGKASAGAAGKMLSGQAGRSNTETGGAAASGSFAGGGTTGWVGFAGASSGPRLVNRYDFSGTGTVLVDSMSGKNGEVMGGAVLDGTGQLTLTGETQKYVRLPSWMVSSMKSVTIVTWFTWHGGRAWQSVFNFGYNKSNTALPSEDVGAEFFFTPMTAATNAANIQPSSWHVAVIYDSGQFSIDSDEAFPTNQPMVVASVFDGDLRQSSLYFNGGLVKAPLSLVSAFGGVYHSLAELKDSNCWLGQSQWAHDVSNSGNFRGVYDEFRIYDGALSAAQIANLSLTDPYQL